MYTQHNLLASPAFHRPRVIACSVVYIDGEFRNRKWSKMKDSEQTDIRFKFSSSRCIGLQILSPNGRNQLMFSTFFRFFGVYPFCYSPFFIFVRSRRSNIPLPNDSSHQKISDAEQIRSNGWILGTFMHEKLCEM